MGYYIFAIGFLAQGFFSARILVQWILSERARKVLSPNIFWIFSLCGSFLMCLYGWLRDDFAIVLGQFVSFYVYIYNLKLKGVWKKMPSVVRILLMLTPVATIIAAALNGMENFHKFFQNAEIPLWLLLFGSAGQLIFTLRFLYQAWYSSRQGESQLPATFWWLSLIGSLSIVIYGIIRKDPVLIVGQSFGLVAYIRNLMIGARQTSAQPLPSDIRKPRD